MLSVLLNKKVLKQLFVHEDRQFCEAALANNIYPPDSAQNAIGSAFFWSRVEGVSMHLLTAF